MAEKAGEIVIVETDAEAEIKNEGDHDRVRAVTEQTDAIDRDHETGNETLHLNVVSVKGSHTGTGTFVLLAMSTCPPCSIKPCKAQGYYLNYLPSSLCL